MEVNSTKGKSRNLSPCQYFDKLQLEYIVAEFRKAIYFNPKSRIYFDRIMEYKKAKIVKLSEQLGIPSIFSEVDRSIIRKLKQEFYGSFGMPIFDGLNSEDIKMYYLPGQEVKVQMAEGICFGKIVDTNTSNNLVKITYSPINSTSNDEVTDWFSMGKIKRMIYSEVLF